MNSTPVITAMMLVRDRADLLPSAASSVLGQESADLELIILDDGSSDATWSVAEQIAANDPRVRILRNTSSVGIPAARNQVLGEASGGYIAICDSDDLSRPTRFAAQQRVLDETPDVVGVGSRISMFEGDPADGREPEWHWGLRDGRLPFAFPAGMFRTCALRSSGGFDATYPIAEDLHLAYRLAGAGGAFRTVDQVLVDYRLHAGSITTQRALLREWCTLRAQLAGVGHLRGRFSLRGYAVICQSALRLALAAVGLRR